jgi:predicted DNA-binding protein (MmcQ/YjbR family)
VEVSRSEKSFGESWRPAYVLKVIGATNFLVKYTHVGNNGALATEILDSQYIRPAHTARKYRFSRSSRVEVMHEGSWWPGVIMEVPVSGVGNKYVVKLKSHETGIDVLTVENTQLRPPFCWDRKNWLLSLEKVHIASTYVCCYSLLLFLMGHELLVTPSVRNKLTHICLDSHVYKCI